MIHHWECLLCPRQFETCCFGHLFDNRGAEEHSRELWSHLCSPCYEKLKVSNSRAWNLLLEMTILRKKEDVLRSLTTYSSDLYKLVEFELSCPEYIAEQKKKEEDSHEWRRSKGIETTGTYPLYTTHHIKGWKDEGDDSDSQN